MVVYSHQFILAAVSRYEAQVDAARIARDYERVARYLFRAVWFREWLTYFPMDNKPMAEVASRPSPRVETEEIAAEIAETENKKKQIGQMAKNSERSTLGVRAGQQVIVSQLEQTQPEYLRICHGSLCGCDLFRVLGW